MFDVLAYQKIESEIPKNVKILAATKMKSIKDIILAINYGIKLIGENYIQEAKEKYEKLNGILKDKDVSFHLIGHLQSNKLKTASEIFDCIETIDSEKIAEKINKICKKLNKKIEVMIEINFDEEQKSGIQLSKLDSLFQKIKTFDHLILVGFMTIPLIGKEEICFRKMRELKEKYKVKEISMGMSSDYKIAIKNGATIIRLGKILFGKR